MINSELTQALSAMAYYTRMTAAGKPIRTDDQRLRMTGFFDPWTLKDYQTGELCNAKGQTWECYQAFSAAAYPQVSPQDPAFRTFSAPCTARPWPRPSLLCSPRGPMTCTGRGNTCGLTTGCGGAKATRPTAQRTTKTLGKFYRGYKTGGD